MKQGLEIISQDRCNMLLIKELPLLDYYYLPYQESCIVEEGDILTEGQLLVKDTGKNRLIHSPVTGVYVETQIHYGEKYIVLKTNKNIRNKEYILQDPTKYTKRILIGQIREAGIINNLSQDLHIILKNNMYNIHTVYINAIENEPFITCNIQLLIEKTKELIQSVQLLKKILNATNINIVISKNKKLASLLEEYIFDKNIRIIQLPKIYPYMHEYLLYNSITKKELINNQEILDNGYFNIDITTLYAVYNALFYHKPFIDRVITIDGAFCAEFGNFQVRIGTPISTFMRPFSVEDSYVMITGDPINGRSLDNEKGISKIMKSVLIFEENLNTPKEEECIHCMKCSTICPTKLIPNELIDFIKWGETKKSIEEGLLSCIECNLCSYMCPSYIPIKDIIMEGKKQIQVIGETSESI